MKGRAVELIVFVVGVVGLLAVLACCLPAEDAAQKAEHVVVVGSYERALDECRSLAIRARDVAVFDTCERATTRALCARRPELQTKTICTEVADAGR